MHPDEDLSNAPTDDQTGEPDVAIEVPPSGEMIDAPHSGPADGQEMPDQE